MQETFGKKLHGKEEGALLSRPMISSSDLLVNICSCVSAVKVNSEPGRNYICMIEIYIRLAGRFKKSGMRDSREQSLILVQPSKVM